MIKQGLLFLITEPEKKIAVVLGYTLTAISIRQIAEGWRMVISVTNQKGEHLVAFILMNTPYDCWWYLEEHLTKVSAPLTFRPDKWKK